MKRTLTAASLALALLLGAAACSSSSGSEGASTTAAPPVSTTAEQTTTSVTSTTTVATTQAPTSTTAAVTPAELPACQDLLEEYADVFTPDDLNPVIVFFRKYAPLMPTEVGAASLRMADAYEAVDGDMSKLDFDDVDLTADATAFSDWTADGCPGK